MSLSLRPMTGAEYEDFLGWSVEHYAGEHVTAGDWPAAGSVERARAEFDTLLPDGPDSADQLLFTAELDGEPVGILWLGLRETGGRRTAWIYDIEVTAGRRGQGLGRSLLAAAEAAAHSAGAERLGLNVFGANTVARGLYESAGYTVTSQQMSKPLSPR